MLGLADGDVLLVEYDPDWVQAFEAERRRISLALADRLLGVQHIGSTAVPGIRAKPILDVLVGVSGLAASADCVAPLRQLGYDYLGDKLVPDGHLFVQGMPRTHHLHIVEWQGRSWADKVRFRDRLRAEPELARQYEAVKLALATRFPKDRLSYTREKGVFIERCVTAG